MTSQPGLGPARCEGPSLRLNSCESEQDWHHEDPVRHMEKILEQSNHLDQVPLNFIYTAVGQAGLWPNFGYFTAGDLGRPLSVFLIQSVQIQT